ncbi:GIY-YIG nuclease family protein [Demequina capsici]|uniref:GIY-YIG nuclease family protein n=1 Tax=Demequina capsici TaxID=3075620 RepID=A0AA96J6N3_9MICO|nr:GIY-YIG nuclease family protein [Demequina sp. OYTSA14]WNM23520.1 GIY-YIG nuclease family protein [Demequina sp. OYTSA14]
MPLGDGGHGDTDADVPGGPEPAVKDELRRYLEADDSRLGEVFRLSQQGRSADSIATELGVATSNFVWNMTRLSHAILDADLPSAPSLAASFASKFRTMLKLRTWSPEARLYLSARLERLEQASEDSEARVEEEEISEDNTRAAEREEVPGIYVYSLPHYLRHPYEPALGHTLLKVGTSDSDAIRRFREQTRTTALPEEPVLLRIYVTGGTERNGPIEAQFHRLLRSASHAPTATRSAGREWFSTTLGFLDEIASMLDLKITVVNDYSVGSA